MEMKTGIGGMTGRTGRDLRHGIRGSCEKGKLKVWPRFGKLEKCGQAEGSSEMDYQK